MLLIYGRTISKVVKWGRGERRSAKKPFVQGKISWKKPMVRPLKDSKATFSQAVKVQPIRKMQRHFWLLILFVFNCGNGLNKWEKCRW